MTIHTEGTSCGHVRSRLDFLFSMTLLRAPPAGMYEYPPPSALFQPATYPAAAATAMYPPQHPHGPAHGMPVAPALAPITTAYVQAPAPYPNM